MEVTKFPPGIPIIRIIIITIDYHPGTISIGIIRGKAITGAIVSFDIFNPNPTHDRAINQLIIFVLVIHVPTKIIINPS
jgi:hypothetical protein